MENQDNSNACAMSTTQSVQSDEKTTRRREECASEESIARVRTENERFAAETGKTRRAFVLTFGCQQNEADSEKIAGLCAAMGYQITKDPSQADLIMVNTCAVREHAEKKALSIVGQYKHLKEQNPGLLIGICGCMVSQAHRQEQIKHSYPYVDFVFGTSSLWRFPQLLCEKITKGRRLFCPEEQEYRVAEGLPVVRESKYRAWVSIMYGCNNFCTYCIVPYVRGRERSRRREEVVAEVRELVQSGYRDITLLGQNVNSYGRDGGFPYDFADLLQELDCIEGDWRLRFMSSHPKDASHKLMETMANSRHIARQFHLPVQAGSDAVLRAMNRRYTSAAYLDTLRYMREQMPDIAVSTDIMVGFPGETDADFEETLNLLRAARFDMIYSFIYSPRRGTLAADRPDQVPEEVKSARFARLLDLQNAISLEKNLPSVGQTLRVLCDGPSKNNSDVDSGRTDGNKIVFFHAEPGDIGRYIHVKIERAEAFALYGTKISE